MAEGSDIYSRTYGVTSSIIESAFDVNLTCDVFSQLTVNFTHSSAAANKNGILTVIAAQK